MEHNEQHIDEPFIENFEQDLLDQIAQEQSLPTRYFGLSWNKLLLLIFLVLIVATYIGILLFGDNSVQVLFGLEEYELYLEEEVVSLKQENSTLQKELFELQELDPDKN